MTCAALAVAGQSCGTTPSKALLADEPAQAGCKVKGIQKSPWIVTLPAENSVELDTALADAGGLVPVRYRGCEMEVLTRCRVEGSYRWRASNLAANSFTVESSDDLYAKMPIGATSIEGHLTRGDALRVSYTLSGRYAADRPTVTYEELSRLGEECATATHLVVGALGGAYDFESVAKATVGGKAGSFGSYDSKAKREILNSRGKANACAGSAAGETSPPHNCGAPLKIELAEVMCPPNMHFEQEKGCVGGAGADGGGRAIIVNAPAPERSFAALVVDATHTALNAARGKPIPAAWSSDEMQRSQGEVVDDTAKLKTLGLVVTDAWVELRGKDSAGAPVGVRLEALVWPDGRVRWAGFHSTAADEPLPEAPEALRPLQDGLVRELTGGGPCSLDIVDQSEIDSFPVPDEQREELIMEIAKANKELPETCQALAGATGPWSIELDRIDVALSSEKGIRVLGADLSFHGDAPKLGRLRFGGM